MERGPSYSVLDFVRDDREKEGEMKKDCRDRKELGPKALKWLREHMPSFAKAEEDVAKAAEHRKQVYRENAK